jgi:hypothetical protein
LRWAVLDQLVLLLRAKWGLVDAAASGYRCCIKRSGVGPQLRALQDSTKRNRGSDPVVVSAYAVTARFALLNMAAIILLPSATN